MDVNSPENTSPENTSPPPPIGYKNPDNIAYTRELVSCATGVDFANTNDTDALQEAGEDMQRALTFGMAWRVYANLVFWKHIKVNFTDPEWARQVMWIIQTITQELERGEHDR